MPKLYAIVRSKETSSLLDFFKSKPIFYGYSLSRIDFFFDLESAKKACEKNMSQQVKNDAVIEMEMKDRKIIGFVDLHQIIDEPSVAVVDREKKSALFTNNEEEDFVVLSPVYNSFTRVEHSDLDDDAFQSLNLIFRWKNESIQSDIYKEVLNEINHRWKESAEFKQQENFKIQPTW